MFEIFYQEQIRIVSATKLSCTSGRCSPLRYTPLGWQAVGARLDELATRLPGNDALILPIASSG